MFRFSELAKTYDGQRSIGEKPTKFIIGEVLIAL